MKILSLSITLFFCLSPTKIEGSDDKCSSVLKELKEIQLQVQKLNQKVDDVVKSVLQINEENNIPDSQVIILAGGKDDYRSVEALNADGSPLCTLADLPDDRVAHKMEGDLLCGGYYPETKTSCIYYHEGQWKTNNWSLLYRRDGHTLWKRSDGIQLLGGRPFPLGNTSEVVTSSGSHKGFDLKYDTLDACAIPVEDFVIITGGARTKTIVTKYDMLGNDEDLPNLNVGRRSHGCGKFYSDNELIYLVVGGFGDNSNYLASTEILRTSQSDWVTLVGGDLPTPRFGLMAISINNSIILTGGEDDSESYLTDILAFEAENLKWKKIGNMKYGRSKHSITTLSSAQVVCVKDKVIE